MARHGAMDAVAVVRVVGFVPRGTHNVTGNVFLRPHHVQRNGSFLFASGGPISTDTEEYLGSLF